MHNASYGLGPGAYSLSVVPRNTLIHGSTTHSLRDVWGPVVSRIVLPRRSEFHA